MGNVVVDILESAFSRWGALTTLAIASLIAGGLFWLMQSEMAHLREQAAISRAELARAQTLWLSECEKPIDECAAAWDNGPTLRKLYRAKVALDGLRER